MLSKRLVSLWPEVQLKWVVNCTKKWNGWNWSKCSKHLASSNKNYFNEHSFETPTKQKQPCNFNTIKSKKQTNHKLCKSIYIKNVNLITYCIKIFFIQSMHVLYVNRIANAKETKKKNKLIQILNHEKGVKVVVWVNKKKQMHVFESFYAQSMPFHFVIISFLWILSVPFLFSVIIWKSFWMQRKSSHFLWESAFLATPITSNLFTSIQWFGFAICNAHLSSEWDLCSSKSSLCVETPTFHFRYWFEIISFFLLKI